MTSGRRVLSRVLIAAALALATSTSVTARADPTSEDLASARELFKEGRALREAGDLPKALEKLRAAHALGQTPITGLELARTYVLVGRLVDAHEVSIGVARLPVASDETEKSEAARAAAAKLAGELEPRLAKLVVTVSGLAAGSVANISVDGERVPPEAIGEPRSADPGTHTIVLQVSGGSEVRAQAELKEGESRVVNLEATPAAAPPAPQPTAPVAPPPPIEAPPGTPPAGDWPKPQRTDLILITGGTVAGLGLVFGAAFGVATLNAKSSLQTDCPGGGCGPSHQGELSSAETKGNIATGAFVVGGVGVGAMVLDLLLRPANAASDSTRAWLRPELGPGWLGAHGAF